MERRYTIETYPVPALYRADEWRVRVGPLELFRDTGIDRHSGAMTRWGAKRAGYRIIRSNERELKRLSAKTETKEVIVHD